jgi:uncharacterized membrane protein (GlpM family)
MRSPMNWKRAALLVVPGLAHLQQERAGRGLTWFVLFTFFLNSYFIAPFLVSSRMFRVGALIATVICWLVAAYDGCRSSPKVQKPT